MGVTERKERDKEEMRVRILNAARKLFLEQGYEKTSIRNIADAIEYSPGTIYLYFKDKNELLFALHSESFIGLIKSFEAVAYIENPMDQLIGMGEQYLRYGLENPELYDLMFLMISPIEALACSDDIWEDGNRAFGMLKAVVQRCLDAGHFKGYDLDDLSMMVWATVHGLVTLHLRKRTLMFDESERIPRLIRALELFSQTLKSL
ncbi:TetR family transcriptional regulator [Emticicia sp. CRIBPO]|uniref:TetR/AcrR family transcriptional regulator n=2 Tax=Bacteria TaxID=2 RepID=UPI0014124605|nr:TetR/AcrR family transcriptional regulator [Emticicia sp. CRIBPO]NBA86700.1 TetR family transcriptional regulator [Emticicia sp. CRIBPO]